MREKYNISLCIVYGLVGVTTLFAIILSRSISDASAYTTDVTVGVPASCTFTAGGGTYNTTISGGSGNPVITANSITTSCNDAAGYAIYAIGYSNNSYTTNNTDLISSLGSTYNIKTDGSSSTGSSWKMKVTSVANATIEGSYATTWQNIPSSFTKVASYSTNTTSGTITPSYQINVTGSQPAGTYTGQVKYILLHPNTMTPAESPELAYTINYNANGGTGTMTSSTSYSLSDFTLPTSTFTPPSGSAGLAGWCTTNTAGSYACDGTSYATNASIPAGTVAAGGTLNLYAVWEVPKTYMQDLTLANCPAGGMTVYDKRDEKDYTVKLINGQCWMTQNLRYLGDTGSSAGTMTIGNNNSNVANKSITLYSLNSYNAQSFGAYSSHCDSTNGYNYACVYDSGNTSTGVWYNYYAASAGTITDSSNSTAATSDICPVGWHLPSGPSTTANTDFNKLVGNTTSGYQDPTSGLTAFPAVAGGRYLNGSLYFTEDGYWWSATAFTTKNRSMLIYDSSNGQFRGNYADSRDSGRFVRCVRSS